MPRIVNAENEHVRSISYEEAAQMVRRGQVTRLPGGRLYRLISRGVSHGKTRISAGGTNAAIGLSQVYTTYERQGGYGFKEIDPLDRELFLGYRSFLPEAQAEYEAIERSMAKLNVKFRGVIPPP